MIRARQLLTTACSLLLVSTHAGAADGMNGARSPYRLRLGDGEAFRLRPAGIEPMGGLAPARLAARPYASQIHRAARKSALDPALVHAVIAVESGYDPSARSPKGALGLMQLMPQTARRYGVSDPMRSAEVNLGAGTRYLSDLIALFEGRLDLALAAYNAGEQAVLRHGKRVPPYRETRHYVKAVIQRYRAFRAGAAFAPATLRVENLPATRLNTDARPAAASILRVRGR